VKSLGIGGELYGNLRRDVSEIFSILSLFAIAEWELWQFIGREILMRISDGRGKIGLAEFWDEFPEEYEKIQSTEAFQRLRGALEEAIHFFQEEIRRGNEFSFSLYEKIKVKLMEANLLKEKSYPLNANLDFLLGGNSLDAINEGNYKIYFGEIHPFFIL